MTYHALKAIPVTASYVFTDYHSQGQTLCLIVDIASPPSGNLNLFNLYVALSQSFGRFGRKIIQLLRDFDENLFLQARDTALME